MTTQTGFRMAGASDAAPEAEMAEARGAARGRPPRAVAATSDTLRMLEASADDATRELADLAAAATGLAGTGPGRDPHVEQGMEDMAELGKRAFGSVEAIVNGAIEKGRLDEQTVRNAAGQVARETGATLAKLLILNPARNALLGDSGQDLLPALFTLRDTGTGGAAAPDTDPASKELAELGRKAFDSLEAIIDGVVEKGKLDEQTARDTAKQIARETGTTLAKLLVLNPLRNALFGDPEQGLLPALVTLPGTPSAKAAEAAAVPGAQPANAAEPFDPAPSARPSPPAETKAEAAKAPGAAPAETAEPIERVNELLREKIELIQEELRLTDLAPEAKARERAELEAINDLKEKGIDLESEAARKYVELRGEEAANQHRLQARQAAWKEIEDIGIKALNDIEAAFVKLFEGGEDGAEQFLQSMRKVLAEAGTGLLRLALINPLKNLFPGQNHPSLWTIFDSGGQAQGGTTGFPSLPGLPSLGNFLPGGGFGPVGIGGSFATSSVGQALGLSTPIMDTWALSSGGVNMLTPAGQAFVGALPGAFGALGGAMAGYQSGSPIMGGLSGGLAAAALGAGPVGIGVAGIAGIVGGLFGGSAKRRAERDRKEVERQQQIAQLMPALEQFYALAGEPMTGVGKALSDLARQFQQLSSQAKALRLDTELLADSFEKAEQRIRDDFAKGIEDAILAFENDALLAYLNLVEAHERRIDEAIDAEADLGRVRHLNALELGRFLEGLSAEQAESLGQAVHLAEVLSAKLRELAGTLASEIDAQVQLSTSAETAAHQAADAFRSIGDGLREIAHQLRGGDLSVLSAEQKLAERRGRFDETAAAAFAGDRDALQRLGAHAQSFLQASQAFHGSTTAYAADFERVMDVLDRAGATAGTQAGQEEDRAEILGVQAALLRKLQEELGRPEGPDAAILRGQLGVLSVIDDVLNGQAQVGVEQLRQMAGVSAGDLTAAEQVAAGNARIASLLEEYLQLQEQERQERLRKQAEDAARAARQAQVDAAAAAARGEAADLSARIAAVRTVSPTTNAQLAVEGFDPMVGTRLWTASDRGSAQFDRAGALRGILSGFAQQLAGITGGTLDVEAAVYAATKGGSGYRIGNVYKAQAFGINDHQALVSSFVRDAAMQLDGIPDALRDAIDGISWTNLPEAFGRLQREVLRIRDLEAASTATPANAAGPAVQGAPPATLAAPLFAPAPPAANEDKGLIARMEALTEEIRALRADNERLAGNLAAVTADGARQVRGAVAENTEQTLKVERAIDRQTQAQLVA